MVNNPLENIVLQGINNFQDYLKKQNQLKERILEELEEEGWETIFFSKSDLFSENKITVCESVKKVGEGKWVGFQKEARVSPVDYYVKELGELLALSRVYSAIKGE